jgi:hypothetical protein
VAKNRPTRSVNPNADTTPRTTPPPSQRRESGATYGDRRVVGDSNRGQGNSSSNRRSTANDRQHRTDRAPARRPIQASPTPSPRSNDRRDRAATVRNTNRPSPTQRAPRGQGGSDTQRRSDVVNSRPTGRPTSASSDKRSSKKSSDRDDDRGSDKRSVVQRRGR